MADIIPSPAAATAALKAPIGWAKARPFVFALLIIAIIVLAIRFRKGIVGGLTGLPGVGKGFAKLLGATPTPTAPA